MTNRTITVRVQGIDDISGLLKNITSDFEILNETAGEIEEAINYEVISAALGDVRGGLSDVASGFQGAFDEAQKFTGAASDLGESINAVNVTFGEGADTILTFGENAAQSIGLAQSEFNALVTPMGAVLKNIAGLNESDAAQWAVDLSTRAADMASVFNTDVDQALGAINSAIRGETDTIEQFGVSLTAATVETRALADTGKESASQLTEQEKATARLNLIMEQTAGVAGDFANTSGGLANQQRILAAEQEELAAQMGQHLLPIQLKMLETFRALPKDVQIAGAVLQTFGDEIGAVVSGMGQTIIGISQLGRVFTLLGPGIKTATVAMRAMGAAMITPPLGIVIAIAAVLVAAYIFRDDIIAIFNKVADVVVPIVEDVASTISGAFNSVLDFLEKNWPLIIGILTGPLGLAIALIATHWDEVKQITSDVWNSIKDFFTDIWNTITGTISDALTSIGDAISQEWADTKADVSAAWEEIKGLISGAWDFITGVISTALDTIGGLISSAWDTLKSVTSEAWNAWDSIIDTAVATVITFISGIPQRILNALGDFSSLLVGVGREIVNGLIRGIENKLGDLWNKVESIPSGIVNRVGGFLGINSPSKVTMALGREITAGLTEGIQDGQRALLTHTQSMLGQLEELFQSALDIQKQIAKITGTTSFVVGQKRYDYNRILGDFESSDINVTREQRIAANLAHGYAPLYGFEMGTPFVPNNMLAFLHKGEAVIPANMNSRNGAGMGGGIVINIGTVNGMNENRTRTLADNLGWYTVSALESRGVKL